MPATSRAGPDPRDGGAVTVEAAIALCGLVAVLAMILAGMSAVLDQIQCTDAARETARLVALGDADRARQVGQRMAPTGASVTVTTQGDIVTAVVSADPVGGLLPGLRVRATAFEVREPEPPRDPATGAASSDVPPSRMQFARPTEGERR